MQLLRDPLWEFVGAVLALLAILLTIQLALQGRKRKSLSYVLAASTKLLAETTEAKEKLEVLYDGVSIPGAHLVLIKLINSGHVPISSADYERPISFSFAENDLILEAEILSTEPNDIEAAIEFDRTTIRLSPLLLNPGDFIELKMLLTQFSGQINVSGRVIGVSKIDRGLGVPPYDLPLSLIYMSFSIGLMGLIVFLLVIIPILVLPSSLTVDNLGGVPIKLALTGPLFFSIGLSFHFLLLLLFYRREKKKFEKWLYRKGQGS